MRVKTLPPQTQLPIFLFGVVGLGCLLLGVGVPEVKID